MNWQHFAPQAPNRARRVFGFVDRFLSHDELHGALVIFKSLRRFIIQVVLVDAIENNASIKIEYTQRVT